MSESWTYNTPPGTPTDGIKITAICIIFTLVSAVFTGLRMYVRLGMIKAFGVDDALTVLAWVTSAGFAVVTILQTKWGLGLLALEDLPTGNLFNFGLLQYAGAPFYITSILAFKLALLFSYLRFIHTGFWRWAVIVTIVLCTIFHMVFLLGQINLCTPVAMQWDPSITEGGCMAGVPFYTSMASLTMVFDIAVMVLPFPVLMGSKIQNRKKLVLLLLLGTGIFITVIQIVRIQTIYRLANYLDSAPLIMWSAVENSLGIIVACVPTLAPLFKYFKDTTTKAVRTDDRYENSNSNSSFALQSWANRSRTDRAGMERLDTAVDIEGDRGTSEKERDDTGSTESILGAKSVGIVKSTDIFVETRSQNRRMS